MNKQISFKKLYEKSITIVTLTMHKQMWHILEQQND